MERYWKAHFEISKENIKIFQWKAIPERIKKCIFLPRHYWHSNFQEIIVDPSSILLSLLYLSLLIEKLWRLKVRLLRNIENFLHKWMNEFEWIFPRKNLQNYAVTSFWTVITFHPVNIKLYRFKEEGTNISWNFERHSLWRTALFFFKLPGKLPFV